MRVALRRPDRRVTKQGLHDPKRCSARRQNRPERVPFHGVHEDRVQGCAEILDRPLRFLVARGVLFQPQLRYAMPDTIETVTSDGRLAVSATTIYRVSDGAMLGALSPGGEVQAASPDGHTLFVATDSGIATVDLTTF